jgi:hypothetical protein
MPTIPSIWDTLRTHKNFTRGQFAETRYKESKKKSPYSSTVTAFPLQSRLDPLFENVRRSLSVDHSFTQPPWLLVSQVGIDEIAPGPDATLALRPATASTDLAVGGPKAREPGATAKTTPPTSRLRSSTTREMILGHEARAK